MAQGQACILHFRGFFPPGVGSLTPGVRGEVVASSRPPPIQPRLATDVAEDRSPPSISPARQRRPTRPMPGGVWQDFPAPLAQAFQRREVTVDIPCSPPGSPRRIGDWPATAELRKNSFASHAGWAAALAGKGKRARGRPGRARRGKGKGAAEGRENDGTIVAAMTYVKPAE